MYHTDTNALIGAPTGSGKTIVSEIAMLKVFRDSNFKVVYIGPLKALVRERLKDWKERFEGILGKKVIELTGDYTPDIKSLKQADIILTTPEKWDGISRNWQQRSYVKKVGLMIIDEIHLLGIERGPILEVIVSRMRYISNQTDTPIRIIGLSTALANPEDLGDWLGITDIGLYNFHPSVRPVPIKILIQGFQGKHYCPRMATMNKPAYDAIKTHSPFKPVLIFVSSRRQTRLTALDIISSAASDEDPRRFLSISDEELNDILNRIQDQNLKHTLSFGIGLHHAGLKSDDRSIVEDLFKSNAIQVLISTSTLAWGVNLPAHLVIIKGTEFFDPKTRRYIDFPITDVLQMMGRAGRPQYDKEGIAVIMVEQSKKNFYKKFIYEPFPVESSLKNFLHDHINAEIVSGTITSKQDAVDYITWTYFFRRLEKNPTYYGLPLATFETINKFLSNMIDETIQDLELAYCIEVNQENNELTSQTLGRIAAYYYLHYTTVETFQQRISEDSTLEDLLNVLSDTSEYDDLPVRHNEDKLNAGLVDKMRWEVDKYALDNPHTKTNILLQAHFSRLSLPISDYYTDLKSCLDNAVRIIQAMVDVSADSGWLFTTLHTVKLMQMVLQGYWYDESTLLQLPGVTKKVVELFYRSGITCLPEIASMDKDKVARLVDTIFDAKKQKKFMNVIETLPIVDVSFSLEKNLGVGSETEIQIKINRVSKYPNKGVYAPRFPKRKDETWWLILGNPHTRELLALRKISFQKHLTTQLMFDVPEEEGDYHYYLYLMCDSYLGLDQQIDIKFKAIPNAKNNKNDDNFEEEIFDDEDF